MSAEWQQRLSTLASAAGMTPAGLEASIAGPHTPNGRAVAAVVFYRARDYWPDFFDITDESPLAIWANVFDRHPLITPAIAERAVDAVVCTTPIDLAPSVFIAAALRLLNEEGAA